LDAQQHTVMRRHRRLCFLFGHTLLNKINCAFATRKPEEPGGHHGSVTNEQLATRLARTFGFLWAKLK
ncbi:MAG: hypothetical protein NTX09_12050, partial [Verrucomicrobia bacterium]|nr:hypothetical protein [Verrucomicrobiota bacterium]